MGSITKTARRGASKLAGQSALRPGQDMLQDLLRAISNMPDAVLLLGGDLTVQVLQAQVCGRGGGVAVERVASSGESVRGGLK